jgi:hypothetical protein
MGWLNNLFKSKEEKTLKGKGFKDAYADRRSPIEKLDSIIEKHDRDTNPNPIRKSDLKDRLDEYLEVTKEATAAGDLQLANLIAKNITRFRKEVEKEKRESVAEKGFHQVSLARAEQIFDKIFADFTPDDIREAIGKPAMKSKDIPTKAMLDAVVKDGFYYSGGRKLKTHRR